MNVAIPVTHAAMSVLGPMRFSIDGRDVPLAKRKARALLAYLALVEGRQDTRERLVGLLWSESEEAKARSSLRQELHQLAEELEPTGFHGLVRSRLRVALEHPRLDVDAETVLAMARQGEIHPRLLNEKFISDSYLRDIDDVDPAFSVWAHARRQTFHDDLLGCLEVALRKLGQDRAASRRCAQAILNLDPTHEEACRVFMRLCAEAGDPAGALRAYNTLFSILEKEYDSEPADETIALVADIKQGLIAPVAEKAPPSLIFPEPAPAVQTLGRLTAAPRMALLIEPFGLNGIGPDSTHLAEGFRHDLIACLVRFREWFVVAGTELPAEELSSGRVSDAFVVAATAYRAGEAISLVLTLRELGSGIHLWSDRYALTLSNWFEAQQDIVRQIAVSLDVQVSAGRLARIANEPDVSLQAYDLWLRGQAALYRFSRQNWDTAAQMFKAATERSPGFARGYSGLSQMNNIAHFVHPGARRTVETVQRTLELARKAVELDPMDSRSQLAMGWSLAMAKQYRPAATHMELARTLNPSDSWVLISAALCHGYCGDFELGGQLAEQSLKLTLAPPRLHWAYVVQIAYMRGDYPGTVDAADKAQEVMFGMIAWRAAALARMGQTAAARDTVDRFLNLVRSAWCGDEPPTPETIGRWLLHMYPISSPSDWAHLRDGVLMAGLPDGGAQHHGWA